MFSRSLLLFLVTASLAAPSLAMPGGGGGDVGCQVGECECRFCYFGCELTTNADMCMQTTGCIQGICAPFYAAEDGKMVRGEGVRRSLLADSKEIQPEDQEYKYLSSKCASFMYEAALLVTDHFYAVAAPSQEAVAAGCPFVVVNSVFETMESNARKQFLIFNSKEEGGPIWDEESYHIGTFKASELLQAYDQVEPNAKAGGAYDILTNNCAHFVINLGKELDVKVDGKLTSYVTRRLVGQASKDLYQRIRDSANLSSFFSGRNLRANVGNQQELVEALVKKHVSENF